MERRRDTRIRDVAERAQVSVGTVSNVLNGSTRVSPAIRERVQAAIAELGYVRNEAARQLRAGRSSMVGLVVLDIGNPFFTDVARGAEAAGSDAGVHVMLAGSDERPDRELAYLDMFESQRVRGVLISPVGDIDERLADLRAAGIPVVLVDRASASGRLSSVSVDDVAGGRMAAEHLLGLGRRRLAFVGGPAGLQQVEERREGAAAAVAEHPDARLETIATRGLTVLEGRRVGQELVARAAGERPDAVFAANDLVAVGLLQALVMSGAARVPDEIALVGYDDIDFAAAAVVPLSSVRQPSERIGSSALRLLLDEAEEPGIAPRQVRFRPELVVRASTGGAGD